MNRRHASAAALGTSAALAAAFLAQPALSSTEPSAATDIATPAQHAYATAAMRTLVRDVAPLHTDSSTGAARPIGLAVGHNCNVSRALVQVLLRRRAHGSSLPPLLLFADRSWPALDTLARHTRSTIVVTSGLVTQVGITPIAMSSSQPTLAVGMPEVLAFLAATNSTATATTTGVTP